MEAIGVKKSCAISSTTTGQSDVESPKSTSESSSSSSVGSLEELHHPKPTRLYKSPYEPMARNISYDASKFLTTPTNGDKMNFISTPSDHSTSARPDSPAMSNNKYNGDVDARKSRATTATSANTFLVSNSYVKRNHLERRHADHLYHLNLILEPNDRSALRHRFGDVKFVITGGTPSRMQSIARLCLQKLNISVAAGLTLCDLCGPHARYVMYKAGPVLAVNHGMGIPSLSIMLHEVFKLLHYAEASSDVTFFRVGTCGGVGVPAGTVVLSNKIYDGLFQTNHQQLILGKRVIRPAILNQQLIDSLVTFASSQRYDFPVCTGATMCTDDFYEGQARLDGAICHYTSEEKLSFLQQCYELGVRNIEMESLAFVAYTHHLGVRAAVICIALLDRLQEDQISADKTPLLDEWEQRPRKFLIDYIASQVQRNNNNNNGHNNSPAGNLLRNSPPTYDQPLALNGSNVESSLYPPMRRSRSLAILALSPEAERALAANAVLDEQAKRMY